MCTESLPEKENWMAAIFDLKGAATMVRPKGKVLEGTATLDAIAFGGESSYK